MEYKGADSCKAVPLAVLRCIVDEIVPIDPEFPMGNNNDSLQASKKIQATAKTRTAHDMYLNSRTRLRPYAKLPVGIRGRL